MTKKSGGDLLWVIHGKKDLNKGRQSKKTALIARERVRIAMGKFAHIAEELERLKIVEYPDVTIKIQNGGEYNEAHT